MIAFLLHYLHLVQEWFIDHQKNLLLLLGIFIVGILSFESGFLRGKLVQSEPLVLSIPAITTAEKSESSTETGDQLTNASPVALKIDAKESLQCPFVGSRNSNKYHLATCAVAKRIKVENRVCFASQEDAKKRGYIPSCMK